MKASGKLAYQAGSYLLKVNNRNTRKTCKVIKAPVRRQSRRPVVFIVNFEQISHIFLVFLLLSLYK